LLTNEQTDGWTNDGENSTPSKWRRLQRLSASTSNRETRQLTKSVR